MSSSGARFVRLRDREPELHTLRSRFGEASIFAAADSPFAAIVLAAPSLQPDDLAELSRDHDEALSIQTQTIADLLVYDHFRQGARTRGFTYAGEAGWTRVVGEPESWEKAAFFAQTRLDERLADLAEETSDEAILQRETNELRRLWTSARVEEGNARPAIDPRTVVAAIFTHYVLPALPIGRMSSAKQRIG